MCFLRETKKVYYSNLNAKNNNKMFWKFFSLVNQAILNI